MFTYDRFGQALPHPMIESIDPPALIRGEYNVITKEIDRFRSDTSSSYKDVMCFLEQERPHLSSIKSKVGKRDLFYVTISTRVIEVCLEKINNALLQEKDRLSQLNLKYEPQFYSYYRDLKDISSVSWSLINHLDKMAMEYQFRYEQFIPTRNEIKKTCDGLCIDTRSKGVKLLNSIDESPVTGCFGELLIGFVKIVIVALLFSGIAAITKMCN